MYRLDARSLDASTGEIGASDVDPAEIATVLQLHTRAVAVITAGGISPVGFCATSLAPVSVRPAVLSFAVARGTRSWRTIQRSHHVLVHLLSEEQQDIAAVFARRGHDKFGSLNWRRGLMGLPQLENVLACLSLAIDHRFEIYDHALVVGRVDAAVCDRRRQPLLHHGGVYSGVRERSA